MSPIDPIWVDLRIRDDLSPILRELRWPLRWLFMQVKLAERALERAKVRAASVPRDYGRLDRWLCAVLGHPGWAGVATYYYEPETKVSSIDATAFGDSKQYLLPIKKVRGWYRTVRWHCTGCGRPTAMLSSFTGPR